MHQLCIDHIFCRLDFECSGGCFPKSTSFAQYYIEMSCCVVHALSSLKELEQHNLVQCGAVQVKSI